MSEAQSVGLWWKFHEIGNDKRAASSRKPIDVLALVLLLGFGMAMSLLFTDGEAAPSVDQVHPEMWPMAKSPVGPDATIEKRITEMLSQMSIEEKIAVAFNSVSVRVP